MNGNCAPLSCWEEVGEVVFLFQGIDGDTLHNEWKSRPCYAASRVKILQSTCTTWVLFPFFRGRDNFHIRLMTPFTSFLDMRQSLRGIMIFLPKSRKGKSQYDLSEECKMHLNTASLLDGTSITLVILLYCRRILCFVFLKTTTTNECIVQRRILLAKIRSIEVVSFWWRCSVYLTDHFFFLDIFLQKRSD